MTRQPPLPAPRAVLFDWDNTLVDNWAVVRAALNHTLVTFGREPWTVEEARHRIARSARDSFPALFGARWEEARALFHETFAATHLDSLSPCAGAAAMLDSLSATGLYLAVVSNKRGDLLRREARHLGWQGYFTTLVGALDAGEDKPAAAPVTLALAAGDIAPGPAVWFVGDATIDIECARNAGCTAILVGDGAIAVDATAPRPDLRIPDLDALSHLVEGR